MENPFTETRIRKLKKLTYEEFFALTYKDFLVSEIEYLIAQTPLRDEDRRLCVALYVKGMTNQELSDSFNFSIDTAKRSRKRLHGEMILTLIKMFLEND